MIGAALVRGLMWLIGLLPHQLRYLFSDFVFLVVYRLLGYRRKVVEHNIRLVYPDKSPAEVQAISREFYKNLCDILVEVCASAHLSEKRARKRIRLSNPEVFESLQAEGKGVLVVWGHYTNFEFMAQALPLLIPHKVFAVYHRLNSPAFNQLVVNIRQRFGLKLFPMEDTYPFMLNNPEPAPAYIFMADQSPHSGKIRHWETFLGLPTPVHLGVENLSKKLNIPVVFLFARREKRGKYVLTARLISAEPTNEPDFAITRAHLRALEEEIHTLPAHWLWSHKRWKYAPVAQPE